MKALSDQLSTLSEKARGTEGTVDAARAKNSASLKARRASLKASISATSEAARGGAAHLEAQVESRATRAKNSVQQQFAEMSDHADQRRAEHDATKANRHADIAEGDASDAIDLAVYVLDRAEAAIIDAVVARADADELASPDLVAAVS